MNQQAKNKRSFSYVTLILLVTLALVVLILGYTLVDSIGLIGRLDKAAWSDNFKLNENQLDVYRYHVAQNQLYYQYMYIQYGMMQDPTGGLVQYMDANTFVNYMLPSTVGTGTYDETAYAYAEQYLTYCEAAREAELYDDYKAEIEAEIDEYIEGLKDIAKALGITFNSYLKNYIGTGVGKNDIRTAMEYYFIGGKHAEALYDDCSGKVTVEEINKHLDENKANFYSTSYSSYKLVSNDMKAAIEKCKTKDEVKTVIVDHYLEQKFESQYKTNFTDKKVEDTAGKEQTKADVRTTLLSLSNIGDAKAVFTDKDTDAYKKAAYTVANAIHTSIKTETAKVSDSTAAWADPTGSSATDLQKWLFGEGRKEGDTKVIETKSTTKDKDGKETTTTSYTWYVVGEDVMKLDEEHTKNAHYIVLSDDKEGTEGAMSAKAKAEAFRKALVELDTADKDKKAEKFAELVEKYSAGSSSELVEFISYEDMKTSYENLADWLYDENRKEGDISEPMEVKGDSKDKEKITGYIVALFMDENEETWKENAREAVANEKMNAWYKEAVEKYNVMTDYEFAEETTAAETEADTKADTDTEGSTEEVTTDAGTSEEVTTDADTSEEVTTDADTSEETTSATTSAE